MEKSFLRFRKVKVNGTVFDVYINLKEKSITVRGEVEDRDEEEMAKKYFRMRALSDYHINYDIYIIY